MNRPGDWNCRSCHHLNFQRRETCQRCGDSKSTVMDFGSFGVPNSSTNNGTGFGFTGSDVRPGDWYCIVGNCGTHNFANRSTCFKCGAFKEDVSGSGGFDCNMPRSRGSSLSSVVGGGGRSNWKSGDWICIRLGCNEHNFANRMECFRCNAPREYSTRPY